MFLLFFPFFFQISDSKNLRSKYLDEQSSFVSLQVYLDGVWTLHSQHPEIGGGTWNRRPAPPWTLWRIRNNNEIRVGGDGWNPGVALRIPVWEDWEPHLREDERGESPGPGTRNRILLRYGSSGSSMDFSKKTWVF